MLDTSLYPMKLQPTLHIKVWGGRMLAERLNKSLPTHEPYGESWELHGTATVLNGSLRGRNLAELTQEFGADLIGAGNDPADGFPLLAKFIDANAWLSIQVHPNDEQAQALEGEPRGKTEAWVVLQADPAARLVVGVRHGTGRTRLAHAIEQNTLDELLEYAEVNAGDVLYIPANTIHALGPGILIYEIQQSSDITYRLYDWGRLGLDGQPRELHIGKGVQVSNLDTLPQVQRPHGDLLIDGDYFRTWRHELRNDRLKLETKDRFQGLTCIAGALQLQAEGHRPVNLAQGETGLIPACLKAYSLAGQGVVIRSCQR
ncbi:MAG: class I mannose-6-phosphate isomerase [Chloroflexi bacterium]|nr:class I mannose-6-phosphate isomerase [Chloroflexota bacterium]